MPPGAPTCQAITGPGEDRFRRSGGVVKTLKRKFLGAATGLLRIQLQQQIMAGLFCCGCHLPRSAAATRFAAMKRL